MRGNQKCNVVCGIFPRRFIRSHIISIAEKHVGAVLSGYFVSIEVPCNFRANVLEFFCSSYRLQCDTVVLFGIEPL